MKQEFFQKNRSALAQTMEDGSILVLFAGKAPHRSADSDYPFSVNRNFYYLTGMDREGQILMMIKADARLETYLYIDERDEHYEKWIGRQITVEQAQQASGIDAIRFVPNFEADLHRGLTRFDISCVYLDLDRNGYGEAETLEQRFGAALIRKYPGIPVYDIFREIALLRMVKQPEEIEQIRKAIAITDEGINRMMTASRPGIAEYALEAEFQYALTSHGVREPMFPTILASGESGCILHYVENNAVAKDGELVLCDLGSRWEYHGADITRTFPIGGKYTERQKVIYEIVLGANRTIIAAVRPGVTIAELNQMTIDFFYEELKKIGLVQAKTEVANYYFHNISHHLGLDTHDVGDRTMPLVPGNVITVEPGLYIAEEGIGIRIEDDILVTETGGENLSAAIIKEIADVETFMQKR